jgi:gamma-glutamyltranspeptidase/glutathione hydrolase/leukotriene-C4 hydrolase
MTVRIPPNTPGEASQVYTIDFRETAPALANKTMYVDNPRAASYGGLSVAVPGELRGFEEAYRRWGSLPWSRLMQPSVDLAAGWTVDVELAKRMQVGDLVVATSLLFIKFQTHSNLMLDEDWRAVFAPDGNILLQAETIRRTNYSRTLATIAAEGPDAFYKV